VRQRDVADAGIVGVERHADLLVEKLSKRMSGDGRDAARLQVGRQANLEHRTGVAHALKQFRVVLQRNAVADARSSVIEYRFPDVLSVFAFTGMNGNGKLQFPRQCERLSMRACREM